MISQLFILSPRGDVIIKKEYRHDVPKTSPETFFRAVRFWKDGERAPAVFAEDGVHYLHVKANGLFLATTTRKNVSPSHVLELLHRVAKVIKDYCGVMNEDALRKNSVLAYELLDEMIDRGYAQVRSLHWSPYDRVGVVNADP
jgi:AP-4 complex subunit mu-1